MPNHHEAQDLTQEIFSRAWRAWPNYDPARSSTATWLYAIAHHTVVDWYRRQRPGGKPRQAPVPDDQLPQEPPAGDEPAAAVLHEELLATLQQSLSLLSDREREAIALRFSRGLRAAEVGQILGLSEGATKMLIHRAIRKLKAVIANA